jgi:phospholipase/carboxylesterase
MNRIQLLERQPTEPFTPHDAFADFPALEIADHYTEHRFFAPLHYEKNYAYPLIVWLHGSDGHERELREVMRHISLRNFVGLAVRGTSESVVHPGHFSWSQTSHDIGRAADTVEDCIALAMKRYNIAPHRIFLVGYESGGTMALRLGWNYPDHFAGVASIGGGIPRSHSPLRQINQIRQLPLLLSYGSESSVLGDDEISDDLRLLHAAGMSASIRRYPCEQEVTTQMLADINSWAMEIVTGSSRTPSGVTRR